ncbi:hypothetical protein MPTK1_1g11020 [Marchantia polymorpha subsp. ruderalis]|uniref:Uncharacterized protein n=2 Tax=Marchantia polymorpha TaxID=3197 RepID=A0AAF6ANV5_MARPO|nr:hypothetical protein MARPO_0014s0123 [Marchantia polymorpha]BBM98125.1 hypothetical protein Mp_1g11020 [Marchantia polymorpha subsp. ruderalis]|eukprot:PTQ45598.1 hypothetical protein MARPO_0014s0123 [Marchantia polymorpha]
MLERALSLRRKILRALKVQNWFGKGSNLSPSPDVTIHKAKPELEEGAADGVPAGIRYTSAHSDSDIGIVCTLRPACERRELTPNTPLAIVIPPAPGIAQSPLRTPDCSRAGSSRSSPTQSHEFASEVERFQRLQVQRRAITRARSMPLSIEDPMRKLRDSYVRMMHQMAHDDATQNPLSPSSALVMNESGSSRVFDYVHRKRTPADEEEEEFCRLHVMRTKFQRSQSSL